jgi:hypothetical protein
VQIGRSRRSEWRPIDEENWLGRSPFLSLSGLRDPAMARRIEWWCRVRAITVRCWAKKGREGRDRFVGGNERATSTHGSVLITHVVGRGKRVTRRQSRRAVSRAILPWENRVRVVSSSLCLHRLHDPAPRAVQPNHLACFVPRVSRAFLFF